MVAHQDPPRPLSDLVLALDIGGTKMAAGLVDESGTLHGARQVPTPKAGAEEIFATLASLIAQVRAAHDGGRIVVCGVGCGGPMRDEGRFVSPLNIHDWREFPLQDSLVALLALPVAVDNDAKALALGEGWVGAARGRRDFLAMVVSTGVGGGIVLDGRLLDGRYGNAGHIGHVIVEPDGRACRCGARGCLEAEASGTALFEMTGVVASEVGPEFVARTGTLVGRGVASVASLLDLDLALVAGSVALGMGAPFFAAANAEVERRARLSFSCETRVLPAGLGADGPLIGAGAVGWRKVKGEELWAT